MHLVDAHPVVLAPGDDDAAELGLRDEAGAADLAAGAVGVVQGQPGLRQRRGDLDDQGGQRVLVGEQDLPVLGQALELLPEVGQPRPVLRRGPAVEDAVRTADAVDRAGRRPGARRPGSPAAHRASARSGNGPATIRAGTVLLIDEQATSPDRRGRRERPHRWKHHARTTEPTP